MKKFIVSFVSFCSLGFSEISPDLDTFGSNFYEKCPKGNVCFSPYSLFSCLSKVSFGAKGETLEEMVKTLYFSDQESLFAFLQKSDQSLRSSDIQIADALWIKEDASLVLDYLNIMQQLNVLVKKTNFNNPNTAALKINQWVDEKTEHAIPKLLSSSDLSTNTELVLTNALHFKACWLKPFSESQTKIADFYVDESSCLPVSMMGQAEHLPYYEDETCQMILLPTAHKGHLSHCFFILPKMPLEDFEKGFSLSTLKHLAALTKVKYVHVKIPKFSLRHKTDASSILKKLGLQKAFSKEADFSRILRDSSFCINKVLHEAFFSIDEKGVTASAATAVTMIRSCAQSKLPKPIEFKADRPFLFGIVDLNSDLVLFLGRLTRP